MPYKDSEKQAEYMRKYRTPYMRQYNEQKRVELKTVKGELDKEDEGNLTTLLMWDTVQETEKNWEQLRRWKTGEEKVPERLDEGIPAKFQPLPEQLQPLLNQFTAINSERRNRVHAKLSQFYYGMSRTERAEAALQATVKMQERQARELSKNSDAAEAELRTMQYAEGIGWRSGKKAETFVQRLERFQWCAKLLKGKGFNWYVTSEACGSEYLNPGDFMTFDEVLQRQYGVASYVPSNKYWDLGGLFRNHRFVETPGDLDWMVEWALSEKEECVKNEAAERQDFKNMCDRVKATEKVQFRAYDLLTREKLTVEQVVESLKPEKDPILDDMELESFVRSTKNQIDTEEKERIFREKADQVFTSEEPEPVAENKKIPAKVKIEAKPVDETEEK